MLKREANPTEEEMLGRIASAMATTMSLLGPIEEATRGYKAKLEAEGWSPGAAETMAMQVHQIMMIKAFGIQ